MDWSNLFFWKTVLAWLLPSNLFSLLHCTWRHCPMSFKLEAFEGAEKPVVSWEEGRNTGGCLGHVGGDLHASSKITSRSTNSLRAGAYGNSCYNSCVVVLYHSCFVILWCPPQLFPSRGEAVISLRLTAGWRQCSASPHLCAAVREA